MKIELKNIKINKTFSFETICFTADIHINNKKVGYANNDGNGGCTFYHYYDVKDRELLKQAEEYIKSFPSTKIIDSDFGRNFEIEASLENYIDDLITTKFNEDERKKFQNKLKKQMETCICYGNINSGSYKVVSFKNKLTIAQMLDNPLLKVSLLRTINGIKEKLEQNETIFNTNIPL